MCTGLQTGAGPELGSRCFCIRFVGAWALLLAMGEAWTVVCKCPKKPRTVCCRRSAWQAMATAHMHRSFQTMCFSMCEMPVGQQPGGEFIVSMQRYILWLEGFAVPAFLPNGNLLLQAPPCSSLQISKIFPVPCKRLSAKALKRCEF